MTPGELLARFRKRRHLTQRDAGQMVGVPQNTWSEWESSRKVPSTPMALKLHAIGAVPLYAWSDDSEIRRQIRALVRPILDFGTTTRATSNRYRGCDARRRTEVGT